MPTARVGAMPHSQAGHNAREAASKKKKERRGKKGITMEDLKQQTAARLAKEQRKRNNAAANRGARSDANLQDPAQIAIVTSTSLEMSVSCDNSVSSASYQNNAHMASKSNVDDFPHGRFGSKPGSNQHSDAYPSPRFQENTLRHHHHRHHHQSPQNHTSQKHHRQGHSGSGNRYSNQNHYVTNRSNHSASSGTSSKLPHGLTVQELKEMTKARLAAEAAEKSSDSVEADSISYAPTYGTAQSRTRICSHESRDGSFGRHPIMSTDSFGSNAPERQRLGSVESFASVPSVPGSGYQSRGLLTPSVSHEQPPVSSFSYDAMDNESYTSAMGMESIFGAETHCSKTTRYSTNSSGYRFPYSSEKSSPGLNTANITPASNGRVLWSDPFVRSSSPVPTIGNSTTSFGQSEQENASFFTNTPTLERFTSVGATVPNAVAESVLGTSEDSLGKHLSELCGDGNIMSSSALVSPEVKSPSNRANLIPYVSPWSDSKERYNDDGNVDNGLAKLQSEWNAFLNLEENNTADNFPLSTFTAKSSDVKSNQSRLNYVENSPYSSPFQTVPEERVIQNLASRDVNVPESFIDEPDEEPSTSKLGSMMRRKKSRN